MRISRAAAAHPDPAHADLNIVSGCHHRGVAEPAPDVPDFGNARHMRNLLDQAITAQALRITTGEADAAEIHTLRPEDLPLPPAPAANDSPGPYL
jgi:hypothetical protein